MNGINSDRFSQKTDRMDENTINISRANDNSTGNGMFELTKLSDKEFKQIRDLVYDQFGINLSDAKKSLVVGRLQKILKQNNFTSFQEYYDHVLSDSSGRALVTLVDRISTNHTFFNRENAHFDFFSQTVLPFFDAQAKSSRVKSEFRLWCAGCSSGEEPYMLAILLKEYFSDRVNGWNLGILATDISISALEKAIAGVYSEENVGHLPDRIKKKYFTNNGDGQYTANNTIKKMITFKRLNLMNEKFPFKNKFHTIFCRNVMIYFDQPTRDSLIARYHRYVVPSGFLFIGHSESLKRTNGLFKYVQPSVYVRA